MLSWPGAAPRRLWHRDNIASSQLNNRRFVACSAKADMSLDRTRADVSALIWVSNDGASRARRGRALQLCEANAR